MTVRVNVTGVGSIGTAHATSLALEISGATVSAVCDFDAGGAAALAADSVRAVLRRHQRSSTPMMSTR
jgi:predicted dehydrogenase